MNTYIKLYNVGLTFSAYQRGRYFVYIWADGSWSFFNEKGRDYHCGYYRYKKGSKYCFVAVVGLFFPEKVLAALRRHFKAIIVLQSNRWFFKKRLNKKEIWL